MRQPLSFRRFAVHRWYSPTFLRRKNGYVTRVAVDRARTDSVPRVGQSRGDLAGLVVLDGSSSLAGAYCAKLLAGAGATVTLLEPPTGTALRRWTCDRELAPGEDGALFRSLRQGERSVTIGDATQVGALVDGADIVIVSRDGPLGSAAELAARDPGLVVVSITPYGLTGPDADRPTTEFTVQADSGALGGRGLADRPPIQMGGARRGMGRRRIRRRRRRWPPVRRQLEDGDGDLIDVSLCEVANLTGSLYADLMYSLAGRPPIDPARPARTVELPSIEPTSDGWVGFNTNSRQQFEAFCILIERPDLIGDEWASLGTRQARADEWNAMVRAWTTRSLDQPHRRAGRAPPRPGGTGVRRARRARARAGDRAPRAGRRRDRHVPHAAPTLDDRR